MQNLQYIICHILYTTHPLAPPIWPVCVALMLIREIVAGLPVSYPPPLYFFFIGYLFLCIIWYLSYTIFYVVYLVYYPLSILLFIFYIILLIFIIKLSNIYLSIYYAKGETEGSKD